jgi:adenylate cyclase class 2
MRNYVAAVAATSTPKTMPPMKKGSVEIEIKLSISDPKLYDKRLRDLGFLPSRARTFESNTLFDSPDQTLRRQGIMLRIRTSGDDQILTFKGPAERGVHKRREEIETSVGDAATFAILLNRLGFVATFRYEKYRAEYSRFGESGVVTLDETPIGWFLELEGPPAWIDATAADLGFQPADYITDSYGALYLEQCSRQGLEPANMVFERT